MKYRIAAVLLLCIVPLIADDTVLTNADIISMQAKVPPDLIIAKIGEAKPMFSVTSGDLIALKQVGVSDDILRAMENRQRGQSVSISRGSKTSERAESGMSNADLSFDRFEVRGLAGINFGSGRKEFLACTQHTAEFQV
jgi:hypothetical protein